MSLFKLGICCDLLTMKHLWYLQELNTLKPDPAWTLGFCHLFQRVCPLQPSHSYHVSLNQAVQWQKLPPLLEELVDRPCAEKMKSTVYTRTSSSLSCPSFLLAHFFCLSLLFYALFHSQILQATYPPQLKTGKMAAVLGWSVVAQSLGGSSRAKGWAEGWWLRYVRRTTRCLEQRIMNLCFDFCWNANRWLRVTRRNMG